MAADHLIDATLLNTITSPDGRLTLDVCPAVGGIITKFVWRKGDQDVHVLRPHDPAKPLSPLEAGNFPLTPFSNRIGNGKLQFEDRAYDIKTPFKSLAHPNHGDGFQSAWTVAEESDHHIVLTLEKAEDPYSYSARQTFRLENDGLYLDIAMTNNGQRLPFGTGHHFYFVRTDSTILKLNAPQVWTSENMLPVDLIDVPGNLDFSRGKILTSDHLPQGGAGDDGTALVDHCFQGWDQRAEITWPESGARVVMTADDVFENFVVFVPSQAGFFCAEPVTNVTDGFNLMARGVKNTGTTILEKGQTLSGQVRLRVEPA